MPEFVAETVLKFLHKHVAIEDDLLRRIDAEANRQQLPRITPEAGRFLQFLVSTLKAKRVLEIGTCLGYSTVWLARGLPPGGRIDTIELDVERAHRAESFLAQAELRDRVQVHVGNAHHLLLRFVAGYDLVFIDAEKEGYADYLRQGIRLLAHGGVLAADNAFWHGSVLNGKDGRPGAIEMRAFLDAALHHPELDATNVLPLGDGLLVARRR